MQTYTMTTSDCSGSINLQSSTSATWGIWCATDSSSCNMTTNTNVIWDQWCSGSSAMTINDIWDTWVDDTSTYIPILNPVDPEQLERERLEREEARRQAEEERAERQRQKEQADQVAKELLEECLSKEQLKMFRDLGCFLVVSQSGRLYRIKKGRTYNVEEVDIQAPDRRIAELCAIPDMRVPDYDTMLAQKLMLEAAEDEFRRIANINRAV